MVRETAAVILSLNISLIELLMEEREVTCYKKAWVFFFSANGK